MRKLVNVIHYHSCCYAHYNKTSVIIYVVHYRIKSAKVLFVQIGSRRLKKGNNFTELWIHILIIKELYYKVGGWGIF